MNTDMAMCLHGVWGVVLAALSVQVITVLLSLLYLNNVLNTMRQSFSHGSLSCLMDINLSSDHPGGEAMKSDPCWQVTQQLHVRIEKTMAERLHTDMFLQQKTPRPSRGFLGERVGPWEGQRGPAFLQNVELRDWDLLVPRAGLYFIYSQTYFRLPPTEEAAGEARQHEDAQLVQYIYKKMSSYAVPILLMKSSRSTCWARGPEPGLFSLHQAGTAHLQPADRLFITVGNVSSVVMDGRTSYFGAYLVG